MKADEYFEQHKLDAGECVEKVEARKVKAGDDIIINVGFNVATTADEDGWQVIADGSFHFMTDEEFTKNFKPVASGQEEKRDLPPGASVTPVQKGQSIVTQPFSDSDLGIESTAGADGFIVKLPENDNKSLFMSDAEFRSVFNTKAAPAAGSADQGIFQVILSEGEKPTRFLLLDQDTLFNFKAGDYTAPAGHVLYENADDEDGYTVVPADDFRSRFAVTKAAAKWEEPSAALKRALQPPKPLNLPKKG